MNSSPRVSVVVPNYNHERFLDRRIRSVLEQTCRDFELILLDDASTDGSVRILERYRDDPRVRIVINERNSGSPFVQWNRGVELARGEYVWIAEADDDAESRLLETLVDRLDADASIVLAYCQSFIIDDAGQRLKSAAFWTDDLDPWRWQSDFRNSGVEEVRRYLVFKNTILNASAVVFRRAAFIAGGGAPADMRLCGDWMTWVFMAMRGDIAFVAAHLNMFRQHAGSVRTSTPYLDLLRESHEVVRAIERRVGIAPEVRGALDAKLLKEWTFLDAKSIPLPLIRKVGTFVWGTHPLAGLRFVVNACIRRALGDAGRAPVRRLRRLLNRSGRV